jgi:hypothetical protein
MVKLSTYIVLSICWIMRVENCYVFAYVFFSLSDYQIYSAVICLLSESSLLTFFCLLYLIAKVLQFFFKFLNCLFGVELTSACPSVQNP